MPFNIGILAGIGERAREAHEQEYTKNKNLLDAAAKTWGHIAEMPESTPELRQFAIGQQLKAATSDPRQKFDKSLSDLSPIQQGLPVSPGREFTNTQPQQAAPVSPLQPPQSFDIPVPFQPGAKVAPFRTPQEMQQEELAGYRKKLGIQHEFDKERFQKVGPDEVLVDPITGQIKGPYTKKPAPPTRYQSKPGQLDGQPFIADFNPLTGRYTHPATGEDISDRFKPSDVVSGGPLEKAIEAYKKEHPGASDHGAYMAIEGSLASMKSNIIEGRQERVGDVGAGRKEVMSTYNDLKEANIRLAAMKDAARRAAVAGNAGPSDMILLSNHIGMTFGNVKGVRAGRDLILEHEKARPWSDSLEVVVQKVLHGGQLSQSQRQEFINAAQNRVKELQNSYQQSKDVWNYSPKGEDKQLLAPVEAPAPAGNEGKVHVKSKATGKTGWVSPQFLDPNKYEKIQ